MILRSLWRRVAGRRDVPEAPRPDARAGAARWAATRAARKDGYRGRREVPALLVHDFGGATDYLELPWGTEVDLPPGTRIGAYPQEISEVVVEYDWSRDRVLRIV